MPRNVRNFWVELSVDGKATQVATGPKNRGGGFNLTVMQRENGGIIVPLKISGWAASDGKLHLEVERCGDVERWVEDGFRSHVLVTER